ncbi:hypothetical protein [Larkinella ripae]
MKHVLLLLLTGLSVAGFAQTEPCVTCYDNPLQTARIESCCPEKAPISSELRAQLIRRQQNFDFHNTMQIIQGPSTLTSLATWTFNNLGFDKKNFVLDADLQIPISFGGKRFGLNEIQVIPRFQFRIFQNDPRVPFGPNGDQSLPVRTPSAMPGIAYYHAFRRLLPADGSSITFVGLYAYHHSNGQDGPEIDPLNPGEVNIYNGNFSEDIVFEFIFGQRHNGTIAFNPFNSRNKKKVSNRQQGKQIRLNMGNRSDFYYKLSYEWHPRKFSNAVFDSLRMMGRHRINVRAGLLAMPRLWTLLGDQNKWCSVAPERNAEQWRLTANLNYILDGNYYRGNTLNREKVGPFNAKRRLNLWLTLYRVLGQSKHAALFAQAGYYGSDNYNIYFNQSLWHFKVGFAFAFFDQREEPDTL